MTTYTAIPDSDIDPESPGTTTLFTRIRDNPIAITEGSSGAPKIQTAAYAAGSVDLAAIGAAAVGQSEIKSTTASQSVVINIGVRLYIAPTGGTYTLSWYLGGNVNVLQLIANGSTYAPRVGVWNSSSGSSYTAYLYSRYIQSSPPWNLGNGDVPLFVMAVIHKTTGKILATYVAEDPPWYAHGKHNLSPSGHIEKELGIWGKDFRKILTGNDPDMSVQEYQNKLKKVKEMSGKKREAILKRKFTHAEKNADMRSVPHLFDLSGFNKNDYKIVMIDPTSDFLEDLMYLNQAMDYSDGDSVSQLLDDGFIEIKDEITKSGLIVPPGIIPVKARWKSTK